MRYANSQIARIAADFGLSRVAPMGVVGWGRKPSGDWAREQAALTGETAIYLEDGFIRSVANEKDPLSIVVDDLGIYYDAGAPSRLEKLIAEPLNDEQQSRARRLIARWRSVRLSKYNAHREDRALVDRLDGEPYVLVCDQTRGDLSIRLGGAGEQTFARMLACAIEEHPNHQIIVKVHPDVLTKKKQGHFDPAALERSFRVHVVADASHPACLLEWASAVYVVTSQMGFEALLWGKPVHAFGMPFYAGWGLTDDRSGAPPRRRAATLEQLVHAALVSYPRYRHPETGRRCEPEEVIDYVEHQMRMRRRFADTVYAVGFSRWKRRILPLFMSGSTVRFVRHGSQVPHGATLVVWGRSEPVGVPSDIRTVRIEDGFLRSVGLGADLTTPLSWVCDDLGMYYDASRPSRLEVILRRTTFTPELCDRAEALRKAILAAGLTKYNLAHPNEGWRRPPTSRRVILVPGQVETDASIRHGAADIRTNLALLQAVRAANPDAYIVYKPHPDVVAGLRQGGHDAEGMRATCDELLLGGDMAQILAVVDEVHTLTSLTGFEALLRGVSVTCYGRPFYAGWGLTQDKAYILRRGRELTLPELVAGALILYPTYISRTTGRFTTPERAVSELMAWRDAGGSRLPLWRRMLRPIFATWKRWF